MARKLTFYGTVIFLMLIILSSAQYSTEAQDRPFTVRVLPISGQPFIIEDFKQGGIRGYHAKWRGSSVTLLFSDIVSISFLKPGDGSYPVEVAFKDGRKDTFNLNPNGPMEGKSTFGNWTMSHTQVKQISFQVVDSTALQSAGETSEYDQVLMKNGDVLSGRVLTTNFILRTSYGTHSFQTKQIQTINLEGGGQNIDLVLLRIGDKLSGVIENAVVKMEMRSGTQVELSKDKVKDIIFKK
jgi:hypothetical protein